MNNVLASGNIKSASEENSDQIQLINKISDIILSNDTTMVKALSLLELDLKDNTRENYQDINDNVASRGNKFGNEGKYTFQSTKYHLKMYY